MLTCNDGPQTFAIRLPPCIRAGTTTKKQSNTKLGDSTRRPFANMGAVLPAHWDGGEVLVQLCERRVFAATDFLKVRVLCCSLATRITCGAIGWR